MFGQLERQKRKDRGNDLMGNYQKLTEQCESEQFRIDSFYKDVQKLQNTPVAQELLQEKIQQAIKNCKENELPSVEEFDLKCGKRDEFYQLYTSIITSQNVINQIENDKEAIIETMREEGLFSNPK